MCVCVCVFVNKGVGEVQSCGTQIPNPSQATDSWSDKQGAHREKKVRKVRVH